jgi:hypothetical protein
VVDAQLGDGVVLDAVRPAPQHLALPQFGDVVFGGLGQDDHVASRDQLLPRPQAGHRPGELRVSYAEPLTVTALEEDTRSQARFDPVQVQRVDRQPVLALLAGCSEQAEAELFHQRSQILRWAQPESDAMSWHPGQRLLASHLALPKAMRPRRQR